MINIMDPSYSIDNELLKDDTPFIDVWHTMVGDLYDYIEHSLQCSLDGLTKEEIRRRCKKIDQGNFQRYYLDDKCILEVEYIPDKNKWILRENDLTAKNSHTES